jgi:hypothetical protein
MSSPGSPIPPPSSRSAEGKIVPTARRPRPRIAEYTPDAMWCFVQQGHFTFIPRNLFHVCSSIFTYGLAPCFGVLLIGKSGVGLAHIAQPCFGRGEENLTAEDVPDAVTKLRRLMQLFFEKVPSPNKVILVSGSGATITLATKEIWGLFKTYVRGVVPNTQAQEEDSEIAYELATEQVYRKVNFNDRIGPRIIFETVDLVTFGPPRMDEFGVRGIVTPKTAHGSDGKEGL